MIRQSVSGLAARSCAISNADSCAARLFPITDWGRNHAFGRIRGLRECSQPRIPGCEILLLLDRPDERRRAANAWLHIDRDAAAATGSKTFDQSNQCLRTRRMIIGDAVHQLPGLLNDL